MGEKLTKAQLALLRELPTHCVAEYRPAQKLVSLGLAVWVTLSRIDITDAGRAALTPSEADHG